MSDLHALARVLGGEVSGDHVMMPGPGHSGHDRSLAVWIGGDGIRVHSHAGDDWRACREHVRARLSTYRIETEFDDPGRRRRRFGHPDRPTVVVDWDRSSRPLSLWGETISIQGTPIEIYLAGRGALALPDSCTDIRYHAACPFRLHGAVAKFPAMLALMRHVMSDTPRAIHRTALKADGTGKADMPDGTSPKKMLGPAKSAAIKIDPDESVTTGLHIGEGIENSLAARQLGYAPVWALGSAGAIAAFPVLSGVEALTIIVDGDDAGKRAAELCAERWLAAGREVLSVQAIGGGDCNDAVCRLSNGR